MIGRYVERYSPFLLTFCIFHSRNLFLTAIIHVIISQYYFHDYCYVLSRKGEGLLLGGGGGLWMDGYFLSGVGGLMVGKISCLENIGDGRHRSESCSEAKSGRTSKS